MAANEGLVAWVVETMGSVGPVTSRPMMGGAVLYCGGTVLAIVGDGGRLWFKSDAEADRLWDAAGRERFTVAMRGKPASMNYRLAPDECLDDADALHRWATLGLAAGMRAPARKRPATGRRRGPRLGPG